MAELQVLDEVSEEASHRRAAVTLADVRDRLSEIGGDGSLEAKLQISAINTVVRALNCAPDDLPVDPARSRQMLRGILPRWPD